MGTEDFVGIVSDLTSYIQNERVRSYNEGVDMMLGSAREWMRLKNYRTSADNLPDILDELMRQVDADPETR